ncbi:hypothetical protein J6590_090918 [Homalodisca vitripennis]|nr:hypothetical protein J6590_090918 [Homalodisca vitripennis]
MTVPGDKAQLDCTCVAIIEMSNYSHDRSGLKERRAQKTMTVCNLIRSQQSLPFPDAMFSIATLGCQNNVYLQMRYASDEESQSGGVLRLKILLSSPYSKEEPY